MLSFEILRRDEVFFRVNHTISMFRKVWLRGERVNRETCIFVKALRTLNLRSCYLVLMCIYLNFWAKVTFNKRRVESISRKLCVESQAPTYCWHLENTWAFSSLELLGSCFHPFVRSDWDLSTKFGIIWDEYSIFNYFLGTFLLWQKCKDTQSSFHLRCWKLLYIDYNDE
jgi:hypothetical protein